MPRSGAADLFWFGIHPPFAESPPVTTIQTCYQHRHEMTTMRATLQLDVKHAIYNLSHEFQMLLKIEAIKVTNFLFPNTLPVETAVGIHRMQYTMLR